MHVSVLLGSVRLYRIIVNLTTLQGQLAPTVRFQLTIHKHVIIMSGARLEEVHGVNPVQLMLYILNTKDLASLFCNSLFVFVSFLISFF